MATEQEEPGRRRIKVVCFVCYSLLIHSPNRCSSEGNGNWVLMKLEGVQFPLAVEEQ